MNQAPGVNYTNYTISQLQAKLRELTDKMRLDYSLNTKMVTAIIPGREAEGPVSVSVSIVESLAENIVNRNNPYTKVLDPATQSQVNNLYAGLQNAINLPSAAPSRRGGRYSKRRPTKRATKKRRNTKRRRGSRK
jgi:hypothetical protein